MEEQGKRTPVLSSPPSTEFPYPMKPSQDQPRAQLDPAFDNVTRNRATSRPRSPYADPPPPDLEYPRRARTELTTQPSSLSFLGMGRRKEKTKTAKRKEETDSETTSTISTSSFSDEEQNLRRSWSQPNYPNQSLARLNRVQTTERGHFGTFSVGLDKDQSTAQVGADGRLAINVREHLQSGYLAKALGLTLQHRPHLRDICKHDKDQSAPDSEPLEVETKPSIVTSGKGVPPMNIVIMVIGSRGDIQPFLKIGKVLKDKYKHRVRVATHPAFKQFVEKDVGLEFFSVGGDPSELMAFMVKNPGLIPSMETVRAGEIGRRRDAMYEMFQGFWRACVNATDDEKDMANIKMMDDRHPFIADAIIANPPSFAHFHCAERLGIPLHLVFTFPYSPTQAFPHPLANIKSSNVDTNYTNFMSYPLVELMVWQGLGDLVNRFRVKSLGLEPMSTLWAPGQLFRLKVPHTYLWSPELIPKPRDWGPEIDIAGYVFLDLSTSYEPPEALAKFLAAGEPPVYIGFGSISGVHDPDGFTRMVLGAVEKAGVRALISKGWGDMGKGMDIPESVLLLDNVPHDWLFPKVSAVIHHGGAGTTAAGLKCGKPTMIVPFFGDQPFWGAMLARSGAGAKECLPLKKLTVESFAEGIKQCLTEEARTNAQKLAEGIAREGDGAEKAVESFHRKLPLDGDHSLRCSVFEDRIAVWRFKKTRFRLSALAAGLLVESGRVQWRELQLIRHNDWKDFMGPGEPVTGAGGVFITGVAEAIGGITSIRGRIKKGLKHRDREIRRTQRRTVASAMAIPGEFVHHRANLAVPQEDRIENQIKKEMEQVNLHGEAAPLTGFLKTVAPRSTTAKPETWDLSGNYRSLGARFGSGTRPRSVPMTLLKATGEGLGHSARALLLVPFEFWYAAALGFHNVPRLYGDSTVRPPPGVITGLRDGLSAAGSGLVHGIADGWTGLVRLPRHGRQVDGNLGLWTGVCKGVGGFYLKPTSGLVGLIGYTGKGIEASARKRVRDTGKTERWIRKGRIAQAEKDALALAELDEAESYDQTDKKNDKQTHQGKGSSTILERARREVLGAWTQFELWREHHSNKEAEQP